MANKRYWVIGGEYRSLDFDQLIDGTAKVIGPFSSFTHAEYAWRAVSEDNRSNCNMRFTIVTEGARAAAKAAA
jgi:uncharacterized protein DUF4170